MGNEKLTTLAKRIRPYIKFQAAELAATVLEGPDIDIDYVTVGRGGDTIITFDNDGNPVAEYAPTSAGFGLALAADAPIVWLYAYTIDGDHTIPASYHVIGNQRDTSILSGQITLSSGSTMTNLSIVRTANDANDLIGVQNAAVGTGKLHGCRVSVAQSGAGNAYAISCTAGQYIYQGDVYAYRVELEATSGSGSGYCARSTNGRLYLYHSKADIYTTDRFTTS